MRIVSVVVLCFALLALSACGFQPRGSAAQLASLGALEITGPDPYSDLLRELRRGAERSTTLAEPGSAPGAKLRIVSEQYNVVPLSVGATAQILEYRARYVVRISFELADGKALLQGEEIALTREYLFNSLGAVGNPAEQEAARQELVREMQATILRRVEFAARTHRSASP